MFWPVGCIDCGYDASFQPPEIAVCPGCGGRLVLAAAETLAFLQDRLAAPDDGAAAAPPVAGLAQVVARTVFVEELEALAHTARVVANLGPEATDEEQAAGWLHDVVEDSNVEAGDLADMGFPAHVVAAVALLSRRYGSDYPAYTERLLAAEGPAAELARTVKLADARENLARCEAAAGVPRWQRLAEQRYRPLLAKLEARAGQGRAAAGMQKSLTAASPVDAFEPPVLVSTALTLEERDVVRYGWFGEPWPSGICDDPDAVQHPVPVGVHCMYCREPIQPFEQGIVYANGPVQHRECSLRAVIGSVAHLERRCSCFVPGSTETDDEELTRREGAIATYLWIEEHGLPF